MAQLGCPDLSKASRVRHGKSPTNDRREESIVVLIPRLGRDDTASRDVTLRDSGRARWYTVQVNSEAVFSEKHDRPRISL